MKSKQDWRTRFDRQFGVEPSDMTVGEFVKVDSVKNFIASLLEEHTKQVIEDCLPEIAKDVPFVTKEETEELKQAAEISHTEKEKGERLHYALERQRFERIKLLGKQELIQVILANLKEKYGIQMVESKQTGQVCCHSEKDVNKITLCLPKGQRIGQAIFCFLDWLKGEKDYHSDITFALPEVEYSNSRMADPFHISDEQFMELWESWLETQG